MGHKAINAFSLKNRLKLLRYILAVKTIDSMPDIFKKTYDIISRLENQSISFSRKRGNIGFSYPIYKNLYNFSLNENSSDAMVFNQVILNEEYKILIDIFQKYNKEPLNIIDAGANIGLTSIYLSHFFPNASIVALEPNKKTFANLEKNVRINKINNIFLQNKGLWNKQTFLKADYAFRDGEAWAFRLEETTEEKNALFESTTVRKICEEFDFEHIDLFKMDIEGGEKEVFSEENLDWLSKVSVIAIEIHEEFIKKEVIENILRDKGFEISYSGELTIGVNPIIMHNNIYNLKHCRSKF